MEDKRGRLYMSESKNKIRNTLGDLNNFLFAQLERLDDEKMSEEQLLQEIARSKAISDIAKNVIENANVVLQAQKHMDEFRGTDAKMPRMLKG